MTLCNHVVRQRLLFHVPKRRAAAGVTNVASRCLSVKAGGVEGNLTDKETSGDQRTSFSRTRSIPTKSFSQRDYLQAYMDLSKARLSALVVSTTAAGFVAAGGPLSVCTLSVCCAGTALCSSSASAWNQIFEQDRDARMKRTAHRPLVALPPVISQQNATIAALTLGASGTALLYVGTNPITAGLGFSNILLYSGLYTYLKPRSEWNTWVGAVVGAIPPVMGWTAAGGNIWDVEALLLGSTLYLWQFPHFFALSYMHRVDYRRGGFEMVPCNDEERAAQLITRYTLYMSTIPFVATALETTSSMFAVEGLALNGYALYVAKKFQDDRTNANARKVFLTSLWYLPCLLMLFLLHSKTWDKEEIDNRKDGEEISLDDKLLAWVKEKVHEIRAQGRQVCVHEMVHDKEKACPVTLAKQTSENGVEVATTVATATSNVTRSLGTQQQN